MGLDQYIYRSRTEFRSLWRDQQKTDTTVQTCDGIPVPIDQLGGMATRETTDLVGYFRKSNAVHGWIVQHIAGGVDECQEIGLDREHVVMLVADLHDAIDDPQGNTALPPRQGFFFGGYDRDEWYVQDLKDALATFTWLLERMDADTETVEAEVASSGKSWLVPSFRYWYQASW